MFNETQIREDTIRESLNTKIKYIEVMGSALRWQRCPKALARGQKMWVQRGEKQTNVFDYLAISLYFARSY